jgi:hypothetical protein
MNPPSAVVAFKWKTPGYRSTFKAEHVNTLQRMVERHYHQPHRFICVTDDATGLNSSIEFVPMWTDYAKVVSPHGGGNPSCYRRLKVFSPEMADVFGPRFLCLDLDTVIVADVTPIWDRPEDFVIWGETNPRSYYNGSMFMMTAGTRRQVWEQFDPKTSPAKAKGAGNFGSDQGWISYCLGPGQPLWTRADGVYSFRVHLEPNGCKLPPDARIVMFHGKTDPDSPKAKTLSWVQQCYQ